MKRTVWTAAALALAAVGPVACGEAPAGTAAEPDAPAGIAADNARLMLPAVPGNPGAVYFDIVNNGAEDATIRAVHVEGAGSAAMHRMTMADGQASMEDAPRVDVPAGETVSFAPGGLHVMAMDLADTLAPGGATEVTLTFSSGDKISFPAEVRAAGDAR